MILSLRSLSMRMGRELPASVLNGVSISAAAIRAAFFCDFETQMY
jgi:hypothetical protein